MPTMTIRIAHEVSFLSFGTSPHRSIAIPRFVLLLRETLEQAHIGDRPPRRGDERLAHTRRNFCATLNEENTLERSEVYRSRTPRRPRPNNHNIYDSHLETPQPIGEPMDLLNTGKVHIISFL